MAEPTEYDGQSELARGRRRHSMKLLFVCSRNRLRSPTAEAVFSECADVETASAGTSIDAENQISLDLLEWADIVFVMERIHQRRLREMFGPALRNKKVVVLGIADKYEYMDSTLIKILKAKLLGHIRR